MIVFDLEANGLLDDATEIFCLCTYNTITDKKESIGRDKLTKESFRQVFRGAEWVVGHNIIGYDIPMISKFFDYNLIEELGKEAIIDTFLWSRVAYPDRDLPRGCPTTIRNKETLKSKKIGPHGLESWGYRCGNKKIEIHDWSVFTDEIIERCEVDVDITYRTYLLLCDELNLNSENPYEAL